MTSPFSDRSMITDPERFFGRKEQLRAIFNALAAPKPQCVSIIGERRIGRSSLLKHIENTYSVDNNLPHPDRYWFAYLDLSRDTCCTPHEFYAEAAQALFGQPYETLTPHQFDDLLIEVNPANRPRYVLLLDEFNALQRRREQFNDDFYDGLRARANNGDLTFVLATHLPLHEIAVQNNFSSTFFGIFTPVFLKAFTLSEARDSVLRQTARPLDDQDFLMIQKWVNKSYHPLKLNIAANLIWHAQPYPKYNRLEIEYQEQIAHAFGHATSELRRKREQQESLHERRSSTKAFIDWITGGHPYMILVILVALILIPLLIYLGHVELQQLIKAVIPEAGSTPTP